MLIRVFAELQSICCFCHATDNTQFNALGTTRTLFSFFQTKLTSINIVDKPETVRTTLSFRRKSIKVVVGHIFETSIKCLFFIQTQCNFVCMFLKALRTTFNQL